MKKFFSRFKTKEPDPTNATWGNETSFYSLLIFLIAIPFVLIVALVWLTGILGFNAYIFVGFAVLLAIAVWRAYRGWGRFKKRMAAQGSGAILNLASVASKLGIADRFAYSMTKGAVLTMTLSVARDYVDQGIRCRCATPMRCCATRRVASSACTR